MATTKPEPWTLLIPDTGYDHPIDIHISEGSEEAKALRQLFRRQTQADELKKQIAETIPLLPTDTQRTKTPTVVHVPTLRVSYQFDKADLDFTWTWRNTIRLTAETTTDKLNRLYLTLATTLDVACSIGDQLDARLRERLSIATTCEKYTVQTVYGVKGWIIMRTPDPTITIDYITDL